MYACNQGVDKVMFLVQLQVQNFQLSNLIVVGIDLNDGSHIIETKGIDTNNRLIPLVTLFPLPLDEIFLHLIMIYNYHLGYI